MSYIVPFSPVFKQQRYTRAWSILNLLLGYCEDSQCLLCKYVEIHLKYTNYYQKFDWKLRSCYSRIEYRHCINKVLTEVFFWIRRQSLSFSKNSTLAKCPLYSSLHSHILLLQDPFQPALLQFFDWNFLCILVPSCALHPILNFIILVTYGEGCKLWTSLLFSHLMLLCSPRIQILS